MIVAITERVKPVEECENMEELMQSVMLHRGYVHETMKLLSEYIGYRGIKHDWTKMEEPGMFMDDINDRNDGIEPLNRSWIKYHTKMERHHLNLAFRPNTNVLDLIEFLADCIVTAKSTGVPLDMEILNLSDEQLRQIYNNTISSLNEMVQVIE